MPHFKTTRLQEMCRANRKSVRRFSVNYIHKILLPLVSAGVLAAGYSATKSQPAGVNNDMSVDRWLMTAHDAKELALKNNKVIEGVRSFTLENRMVNRAYDGAPPTMKHPASFAKTKNCLDCHGQNFKLGNRLARPMPHPYLASCEQCHIEETSELFVIEDETKNYFEGLQPLQSGAKSYEGAPPTMPHAIFMRTNCLACHGTQGYAGLQTDHPERRNCTQCHGVPKPLFIQ
jgi:nitrate reductase (cytochrome), electron transfer subunit